MLNCVMGRYIFEAAQIIQIAQVGKHNDDLSRNTSKYLYICATSMDFTVDTGWLAYIGVV